MATQGTLAITKNNKVQLKLITGSDGYYMPIVLAWLAMNPTVTAQEIFTKTKQFFPAYCHCVQIGPTAIISDETEFGTASDLYERFFDDAEFNPRWEHGTADHTIVADIDNLPAVYTIEQSYIVELYDVLYVGDAVKIHKEKQYALIDITELLFLIDENHVNSDEIAKIEKIITKSGKTLKELRTINQSFVLKAA
tara:strand:- start:1479 stop:2063 length:585 start_codon:yes stop_codon:yes gene_type:complete